MNAETIKVEIHLTKRQIKALSFLYGKPNVMSREEIRSLVVEAFQEDVKQAEESYLKFKKSKQPTQ